MAKLTIWQAAALDHLSGGERLALDVAGYMKLTPNQARGVLNSLVEMDLAVCVALLSKPPQFRWTITEAGRRALAEQEKGR